MPKSMFQAAARQELHQRLAQLPPDRVPHWGKMNAPRMVVHVSDALKMALGEISPVPKSTPFQLPVLKHLAIYVLPWPKGSRTAPELIARVPAAWNGEVVTLGGLIERFADRDQRGAWPRHPLFGTLSGRSWGALAYRHCDHHFTQFGI